MHDDDLRIRIDEDALAAHAEEREGVLRVSHEPGLVAVAVEAGGGAALEVRCLGGGHRLHPGRGHDLSSVE